MNEFRLSRTAPTELISNDNTITQFLTKVATRIQPGLEQTIGAIDWKHGNDEGRDWMANGFLPDGSTIIINVRPLYSEIMLYIAIPGLGHTRSEKWGYIGLVLLALSGIVIGIFTWSFWWGILFFISGIVIWVSIDVALQFRSERLAKRRGIDTIYWEKCFNEIINEVISEYGK